MTFPQRRCIILLAAVLLLVGWLTQPPTPSETEADRLLCERRLGLPVPTPLQHERIPLTRYPEYVNCMRSLGYVDVEMR